MNKSVFKFIITLVLASFLFTACDPAVDKREIKHTIVTNKKSINVYRDSIGSKVASKLNPGDEVLQPEEVSNGMVEIALTKFGPSVGYIKAEYISSDTTIITHSSVLRNEYNQEIVPDLDEKFDAIADWYLDWFPIEEGGFWTYAIILALGIAIFYGLSDTKVPLGGQLITIILYSPVITWLAFYIHKHGLIHVDGFILRLIIMCGFIATTVFMTTALTASVGKLIGHKFTFKFIIWTTISIFLIYLGVAFLHSLCDFFFKFGIVIFGIFFLYFFIDQIISMIRYAEFSLSSIGRLLSNFIIFCLSIVLISVIMIPVQITSSLILMHLLGAFVTILIPILFITTFSYSQAGEYSSMTSSWASDRPQNNNTKYEHEISGGLRRGTGDFDNNWYDENGNKYEETSPGRYCKVK